MCSRKQDHVYKHACIYYILYNYMYQQIRKIEMYDNTTTLKSNSPIT